MAQRIVNGSDAELMVMEMLNDIDSEDLGKVLAIVLGEPVKVIGDDTFQIGEN